MSSATDNLKAALRTMELCPCALHEEQLAIYWFGLDVQDLLLKATDTLKPIIEALGPYLKIYQRERLLPNSKKAIRKTRMR